MAHTDYTPQEISARGKTLYETKLKAQPEPEHIGKYLVIDIETGDYEMGEDDFGVSQRATRKILQGQIWNANRFSYKRNLRQK